MKGWTSKPTFCFFERRINVVSIVVFLVMKRWDKIKVQLRVRTLQSENELHFNTESLMGLKFIEDWASQNMGLEIIHFRNTPLSCVLYAAMSLLRLP